MSSNEGQLECPYCFAQMPAGTGQCPSCHNVLPEKYGQNEVRKIVVIGDTGSGKTVYLSQLMRESTGYFAKVGINASFPTSSVVSFVKDNPIHAGQVLPSSTPLHVEVQQPLFVNLKRHSDEGQTVESTLVFYDVAGEVFRDTTMIKHFAPCVAAADGFILLVDPRQLRDAIEGADSYYGSANQVLDCLVHGLNDKGRALGDEGKSPLPLAVVLSKVDDPRAQELLSHAAADADLRVLLNREVSPVMGKNGLPMASFNAVEHNPIAESLARLFQRVPALYMTLDLGFRQYSFFGVSALGCPPLLEEVEVGIECYVAAGPIAPARIEEPVLWLLNRFGIIGANERLYGPAGTIAECPECGSQRAYEDAYSSEEKAGLFGMRKRVVSYDWHCPDCGHRWRNGNEDGNDVRD